MTTTNNASSAAIMIVEDESIVATDLERSLRQLGYRVLAPAASFEEALLVASEQRPDLVLMDIRIRGERDGIETADQLRRTYQVPVVYMTAYADDETLARAKETGPLGYLLKPFRPRDLRSTVEMALYKHELETRLRERERWLNTLVTSIDDGVLAVDATGCVSFVNPAAEALLGRSRAEIVGRPVVEAMPLYSSEEHAAIEHPLVTAIRERRAVSVFTDMLFKAGERVCLVNDTAAPIMEDERVLGAVMVFRDITEQRRLQRQIESANRLVSLGTMAAGIGHEINNPLAAITSNLDFMLDRLAMPDEPLPQVELKQVLEETRDASRRIREIVKGLSSVARPPDPSPRADVKRAIDWALHATAVELRHRARVICDVPLVPIVAISDTKLGQVLINLLLNAAHAIEPGNVEENEVRVSASARGPDQVVVEVRDTGHGMDAELRARVFEPFFTTKAVGRGTGLGLSVCQGIIKACGGSIELESDVGRGSSFRVVLPAAPAQTPSSMPAQLAALKRRSDVLLVDDDPLVVRALERSLSGFYDVTAVDAVKPAIELFEAGRSFDVILCDLMMPERTGIDLYRYLEQQASPLAARVIFVTGGAPTGAMREFLRRFPKRVLEKPFDVVQLQEAVARVQRSLRQDTDAE